MASYLQKYIDYIRTTGLDPLPIVSFDDDWEPIGPMIRHDLVREQLVEEVSGGIRICQKKSED